jgi:replication fork protection complex subunit Tof1/Swi1
VNYVNLWQVSHTGVGDDDEPEWYVPAGIPPSELRSILVVIDQFLEKPFDLDGQKASEFLNKSRRRRRRRSPSTGSGLPSDEDEPRNSRKEKKKKEKEQYKSAVFIEDSDAEYGDIEAFLEKEKALRERTARIAAETGGAGIMKPTGTKKRRKKPDAGIGKKRKGNDELALVSSDREQAGQTHASGGSEIEVLGSGTSSNAGTSPPVKERPRPRPRPILPASHSPMASDPPSEVLDRVSNDLGEPHRSAADVTLVDSSPEGSPRLRSMGKTRRKIPLFISDYEE